MAKEKAKRREPNPKIVEAKKLYLQGTKLVDIAKILSLPEGTVRRWKCTHNWDDERTLPCERSQKPKKKQTKKPGCGPPGNKHAMTHGLYSKFLPEETKEILEAAKEIDPIELLWQNIQLQYAAILRAQNIMYVNDKADKTIEISAEGQVTGYDIQQAWDKQANFLKAHSTAQKTLEGMIAKYFDLINLSNTTELQKARIELMKAQLEKIKQSDNSKSDDQVVIVNDLNDFKELIVNEEDNKTE